MVFKPGQSGNPSGYNGQKPFHDALNLLLTETWNGKVPSLPRKHTGGQALAHKLFKEAMTRHHNPAAALAMIKEILDRAYGKSVQPIAAEFKVTHGLAERIEKARKLASAVVIDHAIESEKTTSTSED